MPGFVASLGAPERTARDVMASPVVTVSESTEVSEVARLLTAHRIKRMPVLRDGRIVGIVSRADLVRALAAEEPKSIAVNGAGGSLAEAFAGLDHRFFHTSEHPAPLAPPPEHSAAAPTISDFRSLVLDHEHKKMEHEQEVDGRAGVEQRRERVAALINRHISDESWHTLLHQARHSAEQGEKEFMLMRFPSQPLQRWRSGHQHIRDGLAGYPTRRGRGRELYLRWERDLKPHGFPNRRSVSDFPGGMPGDVGLFLFWGQ